MWPHGRATVDPNAPDTWGACDSCGFLCNLADLKWQLEWYGNVLKSTGYRKCCRCMLQPNPQRRILHLPPDPEPAQDPRPLSAAYQLDLEAIQDQFGAALLDEDGNQIFQDQPNNVD